LWQKKRYLKKFSDIIAEKLIGAHGNHFENVIVVLPALKTGNAILQSIRKLSSGAMWLPEMVVMPEFVFRLSGKKTASPVDLMLLLFEAYTKSVSNPDDFATFCSWSSVVLKDFQDIDQYLADSVSLFGNLRNIEEIDHWSLSNEVLTPTQEKYLGFWSDIGLTHQVFQNLREERDSWSYASLVRKLPEWKSELEGKLKGKSIWFVGLTAFTPAEEQMVFMLEEICDVHICWDADQYYFNDPMNEAGSYLRRFAKRKMMDIPFTSTMSVGARSVEVIETATPTGEVLALCDLISQLPPEDYNSTAVVLADSSLIQHVLRTLYDRQIPIQTAMGIPVKNLAQGQWLGLLLQLKSPPRKGKIHFKILLEWLALSSEFGVSNESFTQIKNEVIQEVIIYPGPQQCRDLVERFANDWSWKVLLDTDLSTPAFLNLLRNLLLDYRKTNLQDALKSSVSTSLIATLDELIRLIEIHSFANSFEVIKTIWQQLSSREEIRFESALQDGISVLSMVETRGLDFETLFVLGANEDRFPGNSQEQTFIPWDVRGIFHLPLPDEREATFAYNFYRLIQRPLSIHFLHSSISADYKSSEPSRFIAQLNYEWPFRNKSVQWTKRTVRLESAKKSMAVEKMPNNSFVHKRLDELFAAGLSPSAIGKFNRCPLDFYYRYVIGLGENEEVEERMSAATFGSVIHDVLEHFYRGFINSYPGEKDFDLLISDIKNKLQDAFGRLYSSSQISSGLNLLALDVAAEMLTGYLRSEKQRTHSALEIQKAIVIRDIEFWMERELPASQYGWSKPVKLRGKGDRIEEIAGKHFIIDYKTGKVAEEDYEIKASIADIVEAADRGKLLQLLTYIYMYASKGHDPANINAGFFSFVKPSAGYSYLENSADPTGSNSWIPDFEKAMVEWVQKIYELPHFEHNPDNDYCQYCMS
jgi:ATP-dependent helicase/nuclease subunit B